MNRGWTPDNRGAQLKADTSCFTMALIWGLVMPSLFWIALLNKKIRTQEKLSSTVELIRKEPRNNYSVGR
jgi:hypothetical protein